MNINDDGGGGGDDEDAADDKDVEEKLWWYLKWRRRNTIPRYTTLAVKKTSLSSWRIINLLTYFMEQSPSWEANWFAASQEIPRILWNPKVH